jgi:hypothetical protein
LWYQQSVGFDASRFVPDELDELDDVAMANADHHAFGRAFYSNQIQSLLANVYLVHAVSAATTAAFIATSDDDDDGDCTY